MATTITYKTIFKFRRGLASLWDSVNPILQDGEPGFELDTGKLKIGNGTTAWRDLNYINGTGSLSVDGKSLAVTGDGVGLLNYDSATVGQIPSKGENGLVWIDNHVPISQEEILEVLV